MDEGEEGRGGRGNDEGPESRKREHEEGAGQDRGEERSVRARRDGEYGGKGSTGEEGGVGSEKGREGEREGGKEAWRVGNGEVEPFGVGEGSEKAKYDLGGPGNGRNLWEALAEVRRQQVWATTPRHALLHTTPSSALDDRCHAAPCRTSSFSGRHAQHVEDVFAAWRGGVRPEGLHRSGVLMRRRIPVRRRAITTTRRSIWRTKSREELAARRVRSQSREEAWTFREILWMRTTTSMLGSRRWPRRAWAST